MVLLCEEASQRTHFRQCGCVYRWDFNLYGLWMHSSG